MRSAEAAALSAAVDDRSAVEVRLAEAEVHSEAEAPLAGAADPRVAAHLEAAAGRQAAPSERGEAAVHLEAAGLPRPRAGAVQARLVEGAVRPAAPSGEADRSVRQVLPARAP